MLATFLQILRLQVQFVQFGQALASKLGEVA
jgi:hypothetical protein